MVDSADSAQALYMKIFGEELGARRRWFIALAPLLLILFLIGLFFLAAAGQNRLNEANARVHDSLLRQQALVGFVALVTDAESSQRGYLLTGEPTYLAPFHDAVAKIEGALAAVDRAYDSDDSQAVHELRVLTGKKLAQLESSVALYGGKGSADLVSLGTEAGRLTMDDLVKVAEGLRLQEAERLRAATDSWQSDYRWSRLLIGAGAVLNIALVLLGARLLYADMRRRALQTTGLRDQQRELRRLVEERTHELATLSAHLQGVSEQEKSALSRALHDEMGGLLVAARMDVSWLQQRLPSVDPAVEHRFKRIHESLSTGVDLKRRMVEELRPTLLDNMGLFTALRWQIKETCGRAGLACTESIPEIELKLSPEAAISVFRIAQEALNNIVKHSGARSAEVRIGLEDDSFALRISDDGKGVPLDSLRDQHSHGLAAMRLRVAGLGGSCAIRRAGPEGGTVLEAVIPLKRMLLVETPRPGGEIPSGP